MSIEYVRHPSGMVYPFQKDQSQGQPPDWPGILSDPTERRVMDHHLQLMYRSLELHMGGGRHDLRKGFKLYADWLLGKWYFEAEEMT